MRGEYETAIIRIEPVQELPPRARRIPVWVAGDVHGQRTTSACAENTATSKTESIYYRNYLRVRGEYDALLPELFLFKELPPRARRIRR